MRSRRLVLVVLAAGVLALPAACSTPAAVAPAASTPAAAAESAAPSGPATAPGGATAVDPALDGTWRVDPSLGSEVDWSGSFVGYRVREELASVGTVEAVGRTASVEGSFEIAGTSVTGAEFVADLSTLRSDEPRRDGQVRRQGLETGTYPSGTFALTAPIELGAIPADGVAVTADATGDLTLHGVTRPVTFPLSATRSGEEIVVTGSLVIRWEDFGMTKPSAFIVLSLADELTIELRLRLVKG